MAANTNNLKGDKHGFQCRSLSFVQWVDYRNWGLFFSLFSFLKFHSSDWSTELSFWSDGGLWLVPWAVFLTWQLPLIGPMSCLSDLTAASDWSIDLSFWPDSCLWLVHWAVFLTWQLPRIGPLSSLSDLTEVSLVHCTFFLTWRRPLIGPLRCLSGPTDPSVWS